VKARLVVPRIDGLGDLALHLDAQMVGEHDVGAARFRHLAHGERGGERRRGRVREQAVDAVRRHRELGVVVVVRVDADAVGEGREAGRDPQAAADDGGGTGAEREVGEMAPDELAALRDRPREGEAKAVQDRLPAEVGDIRREIGSRRAADELGHLPREAALRANRRFHGPPLLRPFAGACR
jgi:hypothetical protein